MLFTMADQQEVPHEAPDRNFGGMYHSARVRAVEGNNAYRHFPQTTASPLRYLHYLVLRCDEAITPPNAKNLCSKNVRSTFSLAW